MSAVHSKRNLHWKYDVNKPIYFLHCFLTNAMQGSGSNQLYGILDIKLVHVCCRPQLQQFAKAKGTLKKQSGKGKKTRQ